MFACYIDLFTENIARNFRYSEQIPRTRSVETPVDDDLSLLEPFAELICKTVRIE